MPNIFLVQAAPLLQYIKTNKREVCECICECVSVICQSENAKKCVNYREVCCRSLYCITLYRFVQGKNFKMTPNLHFALIYRDGMRGKCDAGRWSKSKGQALRQRKSFLCVLFWLLALSFFFFFFSSSKCSSFFSFLFVFFSLIVALAVAVVGARTRCSTEGPRRWWWCVLRVSHVLLLTVFIVCDAANYCASSGCF